MATVVLLRGVNVGGTKRFSPAALPGALPALDLVNVGAAGTFVVRATLARAAVLKQLSAGLPFQAEMIDIPGKSLLELADSDPFPARPSGPEYVRYVTFLSAKPKSLPKFPLNRPEAGEWQVQVSGAKNTFVFSLHRRGFARLIYPNEVVESQLKLPATTRNWNTVLKLAEILRRG